MLNFKSKLKIKILNYFFSKEEEVYINQLAKIISEDPGNVCRQLEKLKKEGLLQSRFSGKQKYFSLNKNYPLLKEYRQIFLLNYAWYKLLGAELKKIKNIKEVYLFGSAAKNQLTKDSDLDLLLVGDHNHLSVQKIIVKWQKQLQREINVVDFSSQEFTDKKEKDPFLKNIFQDKIIKII